MADWPKVWVLFATYKRTEAAINTVRSLGEYLKYPNLHFHICDDGSGETDDGTGRWHVGVLAEEFGAFHSEVTWHEMDTPLGKFNTGGNINRGIQAAAANGSNIHVLVFDDWSLQRELDLRPAADVLDTFASVGFIRLSYRVPGLAGVCVRYDVKRLGNAPWMWFRIIREWSLRNPWVQQTYLVSTQPYIAHKRFFDHYGYHPEKVDPGDSEIGMGMQYNQGDENGPQILFNIGVCTTHAPWAHSVGRAHDYAVKHGQIIPRRGYT